MPAWRLVSVVLLLALLGGPVAAINDGPADALDITLTVRPGQPATVQVDLTVDTRGQATLPLVLPRWRPGRYDLLPLADGLTALTAVDGDGRALAVDDLGDGRFAVRTDGAREVSVSYRLAGQALDLRTRHVGAGHVFLLGAAAFLCLPGRLDEPIAVTVVAPPGWDVATTLAPAAAISDGRPPDAPSGQRYLAPDHDALAHAPFEIGRLRRATVRADGLLYDLAVWPADLPLPDDLLADLSRAAATIQQAMGPVGLERCLVIVHEAAELGGSEVAAGMVLQAPRPALDGSSPGDRVLLLELFAHELIHQWNGSRLRAAGLLPFDPSGQATSDLLWFVEGLTTYVSQPLLARAGLLDPDGLLWLLAPYVAWAAQLAPEGEPLWSSPWSLRQASLLAREQPDAMAVCYARGFLLSLILDLRLREISDGRHGAADVIRRLVAARTPDDPSLHEQDVLEVVAALGDGLLAAWLGEQLGTRGPLSPQPDLARVGLACHGDGDQAGLVPATPLDPDQVAAFQRWTGSPAPPAWSRR